MPTFHVAQINVGRAVAPLDDPVMAGFVDRLAEINALGDRSPGFVWRLQGEGGTSSELRYDADPRFLVNLTVWETIDDLFEYTYRSDHRTVFRQRFDWFERLSGPNTCLWWLPAGILPTVEDGRRRLGLLEELGPTREAFTFKQRFPPPG